MPCFTLKIDTRYRGRLWTVSGGVQSITNTSRMTNRPGCFFSQVICFRLSNLWILRWFCDLNTGVFDAAEGQSSNIHTEISFYICLGWHGDPSVIKLHGCLISLLLKGALILRMDYSIQWVFMATSLIWECPYIVLGLAYKWNVVVYSLWNLHWSHKEEIQVIEIFFFPAFSLISSFWSN